MTPARIKLSVAEARDLAEGALRGIGYDAGEARIVADHVVDAALCGYEYSGLAKILNIPDAAHFKQPRRPIKVLRESSVSLAFDGGNNVGMLALYHAAEATIGKAAAHGVALVSVTDAWMSGRSAYFVEMIAKAGLVAIHTAASGPMVAPPGGAKGGARHQSACDRNSVVARAGRARLRHFGLHDDRPDAAGAARRTASRRRRDRARRRADAGPVACAPRRAAAVRRLQGFWAGADDPGAGTARRSGPEHDSKPGYLFIAFRPDLFGPEDVFKAQVTRLIEDIKATPRQAGVEEIRIPSERAFRTRARLLVEGLTIDRLVFDALVAWRGRAGSVMAIEKFESPNKQLGVVARLDRATQYSRDSSAQPRSLWDTGSPAFAGDDSGEDMTPHSRGAICVRVSAIRWPSQNRGRRECRVHERTHCHACKTKNARRPTQVRRNHSGTPCAMVLRLLRALPGVPGLLATIARGKLPQT